MDGEQKINLTRVERRFLKKSLDKMIEGFGDDLSLDDIAEAAGTSKFSICRLFTKAYGVSPIRFLWMFRTMLSAEFMRVAPELTLTDISTMCGFTSAAHFSRTFRKYFGTSASRYRAYHKASPGSKGHWIDKIYDEDQELIKEIMDQTATRQLGIRWPEVTKGLGLTGLKF